MPHVVVRNVSLWDWPWSFGQWCKLFGTDDKVKLGSRFCLILENLAAEDHMAVDDDVTCLDFGKFSLF